MGYKFGGEDERVSDPADTGYAVTPDDDAALDPKPKYLYVGTGGDLILEGADGVELPHRNVPSGSYVPFRAAKVLETGTTATDILAYT